MERDITHRCGHVERRFLAGYWAGDMDRDAVRLERLKCTTCAAEARRAASASKADAARQQLANMQLPSLTGSPRQIAWADGIRLKKLAALRRLAPTALDPAAAITDARWWIDHRTASAAAMAVAVDASTTTQNLSCER